MDVVTDDEDELVDETLPDVVDVEVPDDETSELWDEMTGPLIELPEVQFGFCLVTPFSTMVQSLVLKI